MAPNDPVQLDHERRIRRLEEARVSIENTLLAMIELDRREAAKSEERTAKMAHLERTMVEMGDKLNGLIGWADGTVKKKAPRKRDGRKP
jgi:hypothetical protein